MKRRMLIYFLTLTLILGMIPVTAVTSYAKEENGNCLEDRISDALKTAFFRVIGSDPVLSLFEETTEVETFSRLTGEKNYETLLNIGDSTSFGYGLSTLNPDTADLFSTFGWGKCDPEAWPYLLAEELGIDFEKHTDEEAETPWYLDLTEEGNHFASLAMGFLRTIEFKWLLGDDEVRDDFSVGCFNTESQEENLFGCFHVTDEEGAAVSCVSGGTPNLSELRSLLAKNIENADLITVTIGGNDLLNYTVSASLYKMTSEGENWDYILERNEALKPLKEVLVPLITEYLAEEMAEEDTSEAVYLAEHLTYGYLCFLTLFGDIMDQIHEMNPDADAVLMGLYNPYQSLYYQSEATSGVKLRIGKLVNLVLPLVNGVYRNYAEKHASWCCYVNTVGAEVISETEDYAYVTEEDRNLATNPDVVIQLHVTDDWNLSSHESAAGHRYIFEEMLKALKKDEASVKARKEQEEKTEKHLQTLKNLSAFLELETRNFATEIQKAVSDRDAFLKETKETVETRIAETTNRMETILTEASGVLEGSLESIVNYNRNILSFWKGFKKGYTR